MSESAITAHKEQRLAVVSSILFVLLVLVKFPERIQLLPRWTLYVVVAAEITPIVAIMVMPQRHGLWILERNVTIAFCAIATTLNVLNLANIVDELLHRTQAVSGLLLLTSGLGVWLNNTLAFALFFWIIDRGGPIGRTGKIARRPDWLFPQDSAPAEDYPMGWKPAYVDYLFLGFCTGAAFSPTDVLPLSHRAKLLVMLESAISLLTILVVLSRAVNILS